MKEAQNDNKEVITVSKDRESIAESDDKPSITESIDKEAVVSNTDKEKELVMCELEGGNYYILTLSLEMYYPKTPKLPRW